MGAEQVTGGPQPWDWESVEPVAPARGPERGGKELVVAACSSAWLHVALLVLAAFAVYSNAYDHTFNLDSTHVAKDNPAIRTLEDWTRFFTDPGTFTSLKPNVDYRPVLVLSHAADYALGGYEMSQWHRTQILLHVACVLGLYGLARRVLSRVQGRSTAGGRLIAFLAAAVFAVHPTNCGVVDYISARSSLLTAAFLFPAILAYTRPVGPRAERTMWLAALFYTLALFTKVEAIGCLGVFLAYEVWQTAARNGHRRGFLGDLVATGFRGGFVAGRREDLLATLRRGWLRRLWPMLLVTLVYWFGVRGPLMSDFEYEQASRLQDVTSIDYFRTQLVAWWHYVARWFGATELVADNAVFTIHRSFLEPRVLLALGGWGLVCAFLLGSWRKRPHLTFLAVSALAMLFPTSSFRPLSEMVNEHRPYLPMALLSLVWMLPMGRAVMRAWPVGPVPILAGGLGAALTLAGLGWTAHQRNLVFSTSETYWADVLAKAPHGRAHVNYGLTFLARGDYETALEHFLESLDTTPYWHISHTNLALVYDRLGQPLKAREHFDRAVQYDIYSGTARTWRGEFLLARAEWAAAAEDFEHSIHKSLEHYRNRKGLATALAGLGKAEDCYHQVRHLLDLDEEQLGIDIVPISTPFFQGNERLEAGIVFFQSLLQDLPDTWWVHANLATLARRTGRTELAERSLARSQELAPERP